MNRNYGRLIGLLVVIGMVVSVASAIDRDDLRDELDRSIDGERMQELSVREIKMGEYEDGKTLTDIHGDRVRLEQYILRPAPDQMEFLSYTKRENRTDVLRGLYTLNQDLPTDIRTIGELDPAKWEPGTYNEYYAVDVECSASNDTGDSVKFTSENGSLFDLAGIYNVLYEKSEVKVNDTVKVRSERDGYVPEVNQGSSVLSLPTHPDIPSNLTAPEDQHLYEFDGTFPLVELAIVLNMGFENTWDGELLKDITWDSSIFDKKLDWTNKITFADGSWLEHREAWLKDDGERLTLRSYFNILKGLTPDNWAANISELNHEGIWKASEFKEEDSDTYRKIDVIWSPSIFVKVATSNVEEEIVE